MMGEVRHHPNVYEHVGRATVIGWIRADDNKDDP